MKLHTDQNRKSKPVLAVDAAHDPERNKTGRPALGENTSHQETARRAYELWQKRGCPSGSAATDWFEAEEQLRAGRTSAQVRHATRESGSVQP